MKGDSQPTTRVIVKKDKHGGGHHGGAWKVAYADFVTTMMALFIVLWIVGQGSSTREAIAKYFRDPGVFEKGGKTTMIPGGAGILPEGLLPVGTPEGEKEKEEAILKGVAKRFEEFTAHGGILDSVRDQIKVELTREGLRIELFERENSPFFGVGSATPLPAVKVVLETLAAPLGSLPNPITIEGHTDSRQYSQWRNYSNWELSTDRANIARRILEGGGLSPGRVDRVIGHADRLLMVPNDPLDHSNRRITIVVRRQEQNATPAPEPTVSPLPFVRPARS